MAEECRCHLPLHPPDERYWWPAREPEPGTWVRAVALAGQDPAFLRSERRSDGWHTEGHAAAHPEVTPSHPWRDLGWCWAGACHPVVDISDWRIPPQPADGARNDRRLPGSPWNHIDGVVVTAPVIVCLPGDRARQ